MNLYWLARRFLVVLHIQIDRLFFLFSLLVGLVAEMAFQYLLKKFQKKISRQKICKKKISTKKFQKNFRKNFKKKFKKYFKKFFPNLHSKLAVWFWSMNEFFFFRLGFRLRLAPFDRSKTAPVMSHSDWPSSGAVWFIKSELSKSSPKSSSLELHYKKNHKNSHKTTKKK